MSATTTHRDKAINTLKPRKNGRYVSDDIFKCISWMKTFEFPTRRQAIIWNNDGLAYWRIYASLGIDELTLINEYVHEPFSHGG